MSSLLSPLLEIAPDSTRSCSVYAGTGLLRQMRAIVDFKRYSRILIISDRNLADTHLSALLAGVDRPHHVHFVPAGEGAKSLDVCEEIWGRMIESGFDRTSLVMNLGGGSIGDLGGFAASVFMRGIDFIQIPTTLLAQADASLGGKVAINFRGIKNIIGSFSSPRAVVVDVDTLATVSDREIRSGLGEIAKHAFLFSPALLQKLTSLPARRPQISELLDLVSESCRLKAQIINADFRESGLRKVLNFGHTVGHALEMASHKYGNPLLHGEAVALGMLIESRVAVNRGISHNNFYALIKGALEQVGLPVSLPMLPPGPELEKFMLRDKKNIDGRILLSLVKEVGEPVHDVEVPFAEIETALNQFAEAA